MNRPRVGDTVKVECNNTEFERVIAEVVIEQVDEMGCGCYRLHVQRPGPRNGRIPRMHLRTGCGYHPSHLLES